MHPKQLKEIERVKAQSQQIATGELVPDVVAFMRREIPELGEHLFLTSHIPEQGEEIYGFATSNGLPIMVEVPWDGGKMSISEIANNRSLLEFKQGNLSKDRTLNAIRYILSELTAKGTIDQNR